MWVVVGVVDEEGFVFEVLDVFDEAGGVEVCEFV